MTETRTRDPHHRFLLLLLGVGIVIFWMPRLTQSLWLDETITAWLTNGSLDQTLDRSLAFQAMSPAYYLVAWTGRQLAGASEVALRMPSVLSIGIATYLLFRLGHRLFDEETGLLAAIVLATSAEGAHLATDARPYGLGALAFIAATLSLIRWFESGRRRYLIAYVLSAALVVYVQYVLAPALLAHVAYVWSRRRDLRSPWPVVAGGLAVILLIVPLSPHVVSILERRDVLSLGIGSPGQIFLVLAPLPLVIGMAAGIALSAPRIRLDVNGQRSRSEALALVWTWAVAPPVLLFIASWLMDAGVFAPQHVTQSAPAVALLAAIAIRRLGPPQVRRIVVVSMAIVSLILGGSFRPYQDGWREAIAYSNGLVEHAWTPVLLRPTLVESRSVEWLTDADRTAYLLAPAQVYETEGEAVVLPYGLTSAEQLYLEERVVPIATSASRFPVISLIYDDPVLPWLVGRLRPEGFEIAEERKFGSVVVVLFERT